MKNVVAIIQARMGSTRLPGKVLMDLEGKPVLHRVIERTNAAKTVSAIVIGITALPEDDAIIDCVKACSVQATIFRENPERPRDLLDLYYQAAKNAGADIVLRITSDCPLIDPDIIDQVTQRLLDDPALDYASNVLGKLTYPRGVDVQAITFAALEKIWKISTEAEDREHVTLYLRKHPEEFKTAAIQSPVDLSHHRWTVDEPDDLKLVREIFSRLLPSKPDFRMNDVLALFERDPGLIKINQHVEQKLAQF